MATVMTPSAVPASTMPGTDFSSTFYANEFAPVAKGAGPSLLGDKIAGALTYEGYDHPSVQKVKKLVAKNTISAAGTVDQDVEKLIDNMLCSGGVNVNSNEVVLVVEFQGIEERTRREVEDAKNKVVDGLGEKHSIWPVRVYTAKATGGMSGSFKVMLLNVVNTDVGSPSMVQLLEHHCPVNSWEDAVVSTEAWGQRNFQWRDDKHWRAADDVSEMKVPQVSQEELIHEFEHVIPVMDVNVESDASSSMVDVSKSDSSMSDDEHVAEEAEGKPAVHHPALAELTARDAARAQIQHPTWQHSEENASLIDLVKMHASRNAFGDDAEEVDHSEKSLKAPNEGGFEMV